MKPLESVIGKVGENVLSFGPLGRPWEWWLTVKTESCRDKLLLAGALKVGRVGHLFRVRSAAKSAFVVKVHWAPPFVSNQHLADMLASHCKVILYSKEYCVAEGFQSCATGVRQIMCEGNKATMPYTLNIVCPFTGETFEVLLTIFGRKPICLRCRMEGHIRCDCNTPTCRHCSRKHVLHRQDKNRYFFFLYMFITKPCTIYTIKRSTQQRNNIGKDTALHE